MKFEQILQLTEAISASALTEFKYEEGGVKISMKKAAEGAQPELSGRKHFSEISREAGEEQDEKYAFANSAAFANPEKASGDSSEEMTEGQVVVSPLVGTFYAAPSEESDPFVSVGDQVKKGQVLAIVEAMKLMNEIESEFDGEVAKILVKNGEAVEYGQPLFLLR